MAAVTAATTTTTIVVIATTITVTTIIVFVVAFTFVSVFIVISYVRGDMPYRRRAPPRPCGYTRDSRPVASRSMRESPCGSFPRGRRPVSAARQLCEMYIPRFTSAFFSFASSPREEETCVLFAFFLFSYSPIPGKRCVNAERNITRRMFVNSIVKMMNEVSWLLRIQDFYILA